MARLAVVVPLVVTLALGEAWANDAGQGAGEELQQVARNDREKRGFLFPPFKKRSKKAPSTGSAQAQPPSKPAAGPDPDAPAVEPPAHPSPMGTPSDGIWSWVERMEGEIPSREQVEAIREINEEHDAERSLVDELSRSDVPAAFYEDPARALGTETAKVETIKVQDVDPSEFDIPIEVNDAVEKWIAYFTGNGRKYYERWLSRAPRYQPMMRARLKEAGLPQDLVYLSMIESGYNTHAYSHSDAAGLWQFIPSTGKVYNLRIDWWVDDRRDPEKALQAAITFLGELHRMFGDWRLAWAAYNGGPGRVRRAIDRTGSKDFWVLASGSELHPETENYVPKIMAAAIIGHHPERYGFTNIVPQQELVYDVARVEGSVEFEVLARCAGTTVDELKALNPALRRFATPPEGYDLRVPTGRRNAFLTALAAIPKSERSTMAHHTVRRGETLAIIARRYDTTVEELSRANQLKNINRIAVGMDLVVPRPGGSPPAKAAATSKGSEPEMVLASTSAPKGSSSRTTPKKPAVHVVARGETLSLIAGRYGTTVAALKSKNGIQGSTILVGQRLEIPDSASGTASAEPAARKSSPPQVHVVARGETLVRIATRYGVETEKLQEWNRIDDPAHIEVGQRLTVNGPNPNAVRWTEYTVKQGDSLSKIAIRHSCTVEELQSWNSLRGSVIQPGQKLKIRQ